MPIVRRLAAPEPLWRRQTDLVVVGSGVAGLAAARDAARTGLRVTIVTKGRLTEGSTTWAQGGVAAAIGFEDSPEEHLRDTLVAGAGLCDEDAVRTLVTEGPALLRDLGARFDTDESGGLAFTREGGHSRPRILHAGGDATGREIQRALEHSVDAADRIDILEHAFALDLLRDDAGAAAGVRLGLLDRRGRCVEVGDLVAPAILLAAGGSGQAYVSTSNPSVATGDGVALALRAGAELADMEFVQFHPTVFWHGPSAHGRQLLISEAVRGEGAVLVDALGERVMAGVHPLEDLAPRDVVALAISRRMALAPGGVADHVYLDARALGEETLTRRFPNIVASCREVGIDPVHQLIPVAPAAHYACGGIRADMDGVTSIAGLYAAGEVASTGVHGANRLASNSLVEGLVMATRAVQRIAGSAAPQRIPVELTATPATIEPAARREIVTAMSRDVAVRRTGEGLADAARLFEKCATTCDATGRTAWETTNLHTVASTIVAAAQRRQESRGCHFREDFPTPSDEWIAHVILTAADNELETVVRR